MAEVQSSNTEPVGIPSTTDSAGPQQLQQRGPSLHQIYALPAPIRTFPLPVFYPNNPISFFHVAYAWLGQLWSSPKAEPSVVHNGVWSAATSSVHITDDVATRALWEQGFYGKGSLSRSEPNWLKREQVRQGLADAHVSEIMTVQRREERMRAKWERARLEQEAIRETRLKEAEEAKAREIKAREAKAQQAKAFEAKERELRAQESKDIAEPRTIKPTSLPAVLTAYESPVSPAALLAMPNSAALVIQPKPIKPVNLPVSSPSYDSPVSPASLLALPNSAAEVGKAEVVDDAKNGLDGLGISGVHISALGLSVNTLLNGTITESSSIEEPHGDTTNDTTSIAISSSSNSSDAEDAAKPKKRRKSVRFSPTVESTTFHFGDPPSPKRSFSNGTANGSDDVRAVSPVALNGHEEELPVQNATKPALKNMEHLQLMPEEAFFLSFGLGALTVTDPATGSQLSSLELLKTFRQYSYFPPRVEPEDPALQPDDNFLVHYAVYHHFRSLGWVPRGGIKFGVDWLLYARGPVFDHAEFGLIVVPSYSDAIWKAAGKQNPQKTWQWLHGTVRVLSHVTKSLVLVYVDIPPPSKFEEAMKHGVAEALKLYKVRENVQCLNHQRSLTTKSFKTPPLFEPTSTLKTNDENITISSGDRFIHVQDEKHGGWTRLDAVVLRDSCTCATCVNSASGQKSFATTAIPSDIAIDGIRRTSNGVGITFRNDMYADHEMILPLSIIDKALGNKPVEKMPYPRQDAVYPKTGRTFWDRATIESRVRKIDYHEFMKGSDAFWHTLLDLSNLGLVFLKNVPHGENSIVDITTRIANIKETFYGRTFDVRAKPDAENVAYTSGYLGLHQDLLYLESPPAIQLLHCMENSCNGGESLFSDGLHAGKLLWLQNSPTVKNLARVKIPYHYEKHGYFYRQQRSLFDIGEDGNLAAVYWSPPFQNQFQIPSVDARAWLEPAQLFDGLINDPEAMFEMKMKPGECVLFDNMRVMHGRNQFDVGGGSRWLRGAYIAREDLVSRVLHVPEGLAAEYRAGKEWSREREDEELRASRWFGKVEGQVGDMVDGLRRKGAAELGERDYQVLNC
ncbi:tRNA-splicing endonuclease beta chain [Fusarium heterosporum]|uniref:tRNA-intron lyase n=1 Tax=Fusarium heterosporum TaxID=42747 RepID=A0A8H5TNU3_FUSHE|nr:tRNA-splicing endonuclease beta chain [Fusarium heterosporum]